MMNKKTNEDFIKEVYEKVGNEYIFLDEYINNSTEIRVKHNTCNHIFLCTPLDFIRTKYPKRCPKCKFEKEQKEKQIKFENDVYNLVGDEYKVLGSYKNNSTKIKMFHVTCNKEFLVKPSDFLRKEKNGKKGTRCPHCFKNVRKTTKEWKNEVANKKDGKYYKILGKYVNNKTGIKTKCLKCNNIWYPSPVNFNAGERCPYCKVYKGEEKIKKWLDKNKFQYKRNFKFDDCRNILPLPFDFIVYLDESFILIEYDGKQHFSPKFSFGSKKSEERFIEQKLRDEIKNKYCKENNIKLIRIPYTKYNKINNILKRELLN